MDLFLNWWNITFFTKSFFFLYNQIQVLFCDIFNVMYIICVTSITRKVIPQNDYLHLFSFVFIVIERTEILWIEKLCTYLKINIHWNNM
jgi:hypothetical protein